MDPALYKKLRELFVQAHTTSVAAINALGPQEEDLIAVDDEALVGATLRLQQIAAEILAVQKSEA